MDELESELSKIVGLHDLKLQLRKWAKGMLLDRKRQLMGIKLINSIKPPHMAFLGNPGTGKTSVARMLGKYLLSVGVLSSNKVVEVQRTDLVGEYIGHTGPKTRKKIDEAMGGILFVDEAYQLARADSPRDFGVEALEEIMSVMEDKNLVVIFAGYTDSMRLVFSMNSGLRRRVTHIFQFDDLTCNDLAEMAILRMSKPTEMERFRGFKLHHLCTLDAISRVIEENSYETLRREMNGGLVDQMLIKAKESLDSRLNLDAEGDELVTITLHDLESAFEMISKDYEHIHSHERMNTLERSNSTIHKHNSPTLDSQGCSWVNTKKNKKQRNDDEKLWLKFKSMFYCISSVVLVIGCSAAIHLGSPETMLVTGYCAT